MTTFQGLTATQWRNRINEYNPGMHTKEFLKGKTAKELAEIQNGKSYGVPSKHDKSKPMSAIKKEKVSASNKEKTASDSVQQLLASLSIPAKGSSAQTHKGNGKGWDRGSHLIKKLIIGVLQATEANNKPKAKTHRSGILMRAIS
jgi:hypothetical protein